MLARGKGSVRESVEARRVKIGAGEAWELLCLADEIIVGRGSKYDVFHPAADSKTDILAACLGRSGTLRAPALKIGKRYLIGFNEAMYRAYLR